MRKAWLVSLLAVFMMAGCAEDGGSSKTQTNNNNSDVVNPGGNDTAQNACEKMTCPNGCANGACVDFRSDVNNCGKAGNKCVDGSYCRTGVCVEKCEGEGATICGGKCIDTRNNADNCGECDNPCGAHMVCSNSACICSSSYSDCDGNALNGCETKATECECAPGQTQPCYSSVSETLGVGICRAGVQTCGDDGYFPWNQCEGEVTPSYQEIPGNGLDDDCDGLVDEGGDEDSDGDGWTVAAGDCCDNPVTCMAEDPSKVNPGAIEVSGNGIDDDCDGVIDNAADVCSTTAYSPSANALLSSADAMKLAQAMNICVTGASDKGAAGLISAQLLHADGSALEQSANRAVCGNVTNISPAEQVAVMTKLGGKISPLEGSTMAVISSGKAAGKENTGTKDCMGSEVSVPQVYLDAHGGKLPSSSLCSGKGGGTKANDSVMLRLKFHAPSNAAGFKFRFKFFSKEFPGYVCSDYNDFFLALLSSGHPDIPADHNISFDTAGNPVSVNNAFFTECDKGACEADADCKATINESTCSDGASNVEAYFSSSGAGATRWLETSAPIVPGEVFTLDLIIFDAGDRDPSKTNGWGHQRDSLVLLDSFEWTTEETHLGTIIL